MKIAIIGAGISGLSCALELNRLGFSPVVFEKTHELGDKPVLQKLNWGWQCPISRKVI